MSKQTNCLPCTCTIYTLRIKIQVSIDYTHWIVNTCESQLFTFFWYKRSQYNKIFNLILNLKYLPRLTISKDTYNPKMKICISLLIALLGIEQISALSGKYSVKGYLKCNNRPVTDARLILYDEDTGWQRGMSKNMR